MTFHIAGSGVVSFMNELTEAGSELSSVLLLVSEVLSDSDSVSETASVVVIDGSMPLLFLLSDDSTYSSQDTAEQVRTRAESRAAVFMIFIYPIPLSL